jgi:hypothetical protein
MLRPSIRHPRNKRNRKGTRPALECLEPRVVLSTFTVNTVLDSVAKDPKTGGKNASGHISLRSAIQAANARPNADTIILPAGTIALMLSVPGENNAASGDLDIRGSVKITGKGAGKTIIDGNDNDRVFDIFSGNFAISGVTIQHGRAQLEGGGLLNEGGNVPLTNVDLENNVAFGTDRPNGFNGSGGSGGGGGGRFNDQGGAVILKAQANLKNQPKGTFGSNQANGGFGGGEGLDRSAFGGLGGASAAVSTGGDGGSAVAGNGGNGGHANAARGGGIYTEGVVSVTGVTISFLNNQVRGGSGGKPRLGGTVCSISSRSPSAVASKRSAIPQSTTPVLRVITPIPTSTTWPARSRADGKAAMRTRSMPEPLICRRTNARFP